MQLRRVLIDVEPLRGCPPFRRLWFGRSLSALGSQLSFVAVLFQIWQATGSTVWAGAVGLAQALPLVLLGLFAGALVDRVDRRRCYLYGTGGQALCAGLLAWQGLVAPLPPAGVLGLLAAQSCCAALSGPAARAFVPLLLPARQLAAGLALQRVAFQGAMLFGPALGGLVVGRWGVGVGYLLDAISFLAALHGAYRLPQLSSGGRPARPGQAGLRDGVAFLARMPLVRGALLTDLATTVLSMPVSLFPVVNSERFGGSPRTLGLFLTALAVGGVAASLCSGAFTRLPRPGRVMLLGSATWGVSLLLFGLAANSPVALACLVLAGAADTVAVVSRGTVVQANTPPEYLGRMAAVEQIVGQAGPDLGNLRAGVVAGASSAATALVSGGLLCLAAVAAVAATGPELRGSAAFVRRESSAGA
ncbi:MFS transporter [Kitasatospora sp. MMS16-BH015]|uniref:MFS transporter n=1 Tax=Kitasatospora sp. MMS16-BH015 TaxID=2018025 RepID=UPI000CA3DC4E|nr:MFS transporter [Kitasatospora sp. MMS16-BH015]AUG80226.1 MFS transporter [Kitasatospora sp. MMS16-BH015]